MYRPNAYREHRREVLLSIMKDNPFAILISHGPAGLVATHLPVLVKESGQENIELRGHLAKANRQWRDLEPESQVMVVFTGVHSYISPDWYSVEPDVPTWNYQAVHAYGSWSLLDAHTELPALLAETVQRFEQPRANPWTLSRLNHNLVASLRGGVVGFRVDVTHLEGATKLSQDKCPADVIGVANGLRAEGGEAERALALEVEHANSIGPFSGRSD